MTTSASPGRPIANTDQLAAFGWPADCHIQGGAVGVVFGRTGSYRTAFFEAFPDGSFIRGEGDTIAAAEAAAWAKFTKSTSCPGHLWEPRGYRNGGGFCALCGTFRARVFTGSQLGQLCHACGAPTTWTWEEIPADGDEPAHTLFTCRDDDLIYAQRMARRACDVVTAADVAEPVAEMLPSLEDDQK